jgi:hypothetical protein
MKNSTAFAAAALCSLFFWDTAYGQAPGVPVGAGAGATRQPAGSRFRNRAREALWARPSFYQCRHAGLAFRRRDVSRGPEAGEDG